MQIIKDKDLIAYRVSLQEMLDRATESFAFLMEELQNKRKVSPLTENDKKNLKNKIEEVCSLNYELNYGNYFFNKNNDFRAAVINEITNRCLNDLNDPQVETIFSYSMIAIYRYMEEELRKKIGK